MVNFTFKSFTYKVIPNSLHFRVAGACDEEGWICEFLGKYNAIFVGKVTFWYKSDIFGEKLLFLGKGYFFGGKVGDHYD